MSILKSKKVMIVKLYYFKIRGTPKIVGPSVTYPSRAASRYLSFPDESRIQPCYHAGTLFLLLFVFAISQSFEFLTCIFLYPRLGFEPDTLRLLVNRNRILSANLNANFYYYYLGFDS